MSLERRPGASTASHALPPPPLPTPFIPPPQRHPPMARGPRPPSPPSLSPSAFSLVAPGPSAGSSVLPLPGDHARSALSRRGFFRLAAEVLVGAALAGLAWPGGLPGAIAAADVAALSATAVLLAAASGDARTAAISPPSAPSGTLFGFSRDGNAGQRRFFGTTTEALAQTLSTAFAAAAVL